MSRPATLRDIAACTGFGIATVSRALNGRSRVAAATRKAVLAAATELGYRPDPAMRVFVKRRWPERGASCLNVGLLLPAGDLRGTETERFKWALQACAESCGFQLVTLSLAEFPRLSALRRRVMAQGISGLMVPPMAVPAWDLEPLFTELPAVLCAPAEYSPGIPLVAPDDYLRAKRAWEHVLACGHKRIGVVMPDHAPAESVDARMSGLLVGWAKQEPLIPIWRYGAEPDRQGLRAWYERFKPEAILGFSPEDLILLAKSGVPAPESVGFAALYLFDEREVGHFPGSYWARDRVCRRAWDRLEFMIQNQLTGADLRGTKELIDLPYTGGKSLPVLKAPSRGA